MALWEMTVVMAGAKKKKKKAYKIKCRKYLLSKFQEF
jgi:hypothetical protein